MKLLLYCTKSKPYLFNWGGKPPYATASFDTIKHLSLNGKIVAECDFEVEHIYYDNWFKCYGTKTLGIISLPEKSCLSTEELKEYLGTTNKYYKNQYWIPYLGYANHIKNLHIFDKAKELNEYWSIKRPFRNIEKAPQNMMRVNYSYNKELTVMKKKIDAIAVGEYILISIRPEWLCKILNGEKTIEIRKKVLKEML